MALLFIDSFDHYASADLAKKGWASAGSKVDVAPSGRRGSGACAAPSAASSGSITRTFAAKSSLVVGVAFSINAFTTNRAPVISFLDAGTAQCELQLNSDGTLSVTRNGNALSGGTSAFAITPGLFYYIEWKVTIADSIGAESCKVRVNNADWITVAAGADLKNTANATVNQVRLGSSSAIGTALTYLYDDMYLCDQTGAVNADFLGDVRIDAILPNADGTYSQFSPDSGTVHFSRVNEVTPDLTSYNEGVNIGDRDSYALADLSAIASQTIFGIQVNAALSKDDAGAKTAAVMVRSGGVNSDGPAVALSTSQAFALRVLETDPNGGAAFTPSVVNAIEAGVVVTA